MLVEGFREVQYCSWWVYAVLRGISALIVIIVVRSLRLETVVNDRASEMLADPAASHLSRVQWSAALER